MADAGNAKKAPQYLAAVCICIGAMGAGTVISWTANITDKLNAGDLNDIKMDDNRLGWAGSTMTLGAMLICFPIGWIADWIGRKPTVLLTTIPIVAGWLLITFAQHISMVYVGRLLSGMAGGAFCIIAPLYTSEIAETEIRGRLGALGTGTVLAWTANITDSLKDGHLGGFKMNDDELGWTGSSMTLGAMIMCFPIGWIADCIGRKPTVLLTTIPFVLGWLVITFAQHITMVYIGRFLTGVAGGSFCVTAPLYTSEIGETEIRGRLGTFFQLFITIGILYAMVFGYVLPLMVYNFACMGVPIVFAIVFIFQPETPVYLVRKGKPADKVKKAFERVRGKQYDASGEIKATEDQVAKEAQHPKFSDSMKSKAAKKATLICFMLMFYQQMSGINSVIFYANRIFTDAGSELAPHWCVIIIGIVQVIATIFSSWSVEKIGRKILLMASCGFMALSCCLLGLFFTLKDHKIIDEYGLKDIGFLPVLSVIIFIVAFSIGLGPIPWMSSSEIFPPEIKAKCSSAAATFNWLLAFIITKWYLNVATAIGTDITFYFFCIVMVTGVFFVLIVIPETKNKSFGAIQDELGGS